MHIPVLWQEIAKRVHFKAGGCFLDATFGAGGYTRGILQCCPSAGAIYAVDRDESAIALAQDLALQHACIKPLLAVHSQMQNLLPPGLQFDAVFLDAGCCSRQLDNPARGFSYQVNGPLDMRMGLADCQVKAADAVNGLSELQLSLLLQQGGGDRRSASIAAAICAYRKAKGPIADCETLRLIVCDGGRLPPHAARQTFQALRIWVNDEAAELAAALETCLTRLAPGGYLVVVTFHSGECSIVKAFFKQHAACFTRISTINPSREEVKANVRSRSARLRYAQVIGGLNDA